MNNNTEKKLEDNKKPFTVSAPAVTLPKGGGAIRGIGEKFGANPVTGTGSMSVPIATSPGRSGFGPQLSLSYDSGSGNGPFGFGWNLFLPSITRKTDKGIPRYHDAEESDVFVLSGAEDLVPVLIEKDGKWEREKLPPRTAEGKEYKIQRYRPRIEGLFARIERWTDQADPGDTFWRSISKDNITSWYGKTPESRIADTTDPARIFSWMICESYDDKGNAIVYEYVPEDSSGIDLSLAHEQNRTSTGRSSNRYLKRIKYGNLPSRLVEPDLSKLKWLFEVVFDYDEKHYDVLPQDPSGHVFVRVKNKVKGDAIDGDRARQWTVRQDPFSTYRAGFEIRTCRLCRRVLMLHHFSDELGIDDYLVRSTEFSYEQSPIASFITSVTQSGYVLKPGDRFLKKSLPPLEFEYSKAKIDETVREVDPESLENLPYGFDGSIYQWIDLDGEGVSGILTEQAGSWYYKRNVSANNVVKDNGAKRTAPKFAPVESVAAMPNAALAGGRSQFMDLAGDGQVDLVSFEKPLPGLYERTDEADWETFRPFSSWPNIDMRDSNLKFVDLDGDGHADILITEDDAFTWYPSLAEKGFGPALRVSVRLDEERGPRLVLADGTESVYLADLSGDGLTDLVRIRNGEVCYWPNVGYGKFGAKVTMDNAPWFDRPDSFDQKRVRLADIDGSGTTDIIYLGAHRIDIYRNEVGNSWAARESLSSFPQIDNLSSVAAIDLLGNGNACLVWSSPLPSNARRPMRYIDLMCGQKPHLLLKSVNNLGAETRVHYAPSTKFYLADKENGKPWITKLPFPVHVIERVETYDHISRNRFVTRYAYHHGYFDGVEREFRGFGMVEQFDTEEFAALSGGDFIPDATNIDQASHVPPVLTKTWFHTGAYIDREHISNFFAGMGEGEGEYYREPGLTDEQAKELLLEDTILPDGLSLEEEREACCTLKGLMLRQEIYALDGSDREKHPYTVTEQNFTIDLVQSRGDNRDAVFFTHPRESLSYHYERNPADPRVIHTITLEVDPFGGVQKSISIGYGRREGRSPLQGDDRKKQEQVVVIYTENIFTNPVDDVALFPDDHHTPLPGEMRIFEVTGFTPAQGAVRFSFADFADDDFQALLALPEIAFEEAPDFTKKQKRMIRCTRTLYRKDDLSGLLGTRALEPNAVPGESYQLAFTGRLLDQVYVRDGRKLLPDPGSVLGSGGPDRGGYRLSQDLKAAGLFPGTDPDDQYWIPSGRIFYSPEAGDSAAQELVHARRHFFVPRRYHDPFHSDVFRTETVLDYDRYDLLIVETLDALDNRVSIGERDQNPRQPLIKQGNDYRVLQPRFMMDPNRNCSEAIFDSLGLVVGTAVMGKPEDNPPKGDRLEPGFQADLTAAELEAVYADPKGQAAGLLGSATTRIVYDLHRFRLAREADAGDLSKREPSFTLSLARETHVSDPAPAGGVNVQVSFMYSDGYGRQVQKKTQAEPGPVPKRDAAGRIVVGPDGQPEMTPHAVTTRWVGSGWTVFNNKGKPVRQYEPFFSDTHRPDFDARIGISPALFYDPAARVLATLHPNHTYEKAAFDPWMQKMYDVNDTISLDPRTDPDIEGFVRTYFASLPASWKTWLQQRVADPQSPPADTNGQNPAQDAAVRTLVHSGTPTTAHQDTLGRTFLTYVHNRYERDEAVVDEFYPTRVELDIEGNQRMLRDPQGRIVTRSDYDMLGNRIRQAGMEAGARWMLHDVTTRPIRAWDSRGHDFSIEYDRLRRPVARRVSGTDANQSDSRTLYGTLLFEKIEYGEGQADNIERNLRARAFNRYDGAGKMTNEAYDFKGNLLRSTREVAQGYKDIIDWARAQPQGERFRSSISYDAFNRPVTLTVQDNSVIRPAYNEANLLERLDADLRGASTATPFVTNIDYNARGQRTRIDYGTMDDSGITTIYDYDPDTFRLIRMKTRRNGSKFDTTDRPREVQNLSYTYDPAGNITHIQDDAQQTIYFRNREVEPGNDYTYDAIYRLTQAAGREHLGQIGSPIPNSYNDYRRTRLPHPEDGNAMGRYREIYRYDEVGNFLDMIHRGADPANPGWTRGYVYQEASLMEPGKQSNRLTKTEIGGTAEIYSYDIHGNMLHMPHLQVLQWDFRDRLLMSQRQRVNDEDEEGGQREGEKTWYVYDADGQRTRKVTEFATGRVKDERIYVGGFEVYRAYGTNAFERETLHIMDNKQRIAQVETKIEERGFLNRLRGMLTGPDMLIRYQFGNHLGSTSLELDDRAQIISYEEYMPYGSTSYQGVRSRAETPNRYRYSSKERDEESGLYYYGARYYAADIAVWISCDPPGGAIQSSSTYGFCSNNPIARRDPDGREDQLAVRESNLYYDFDHYQPQSKYPELANQAGNLGFMAADENRRKQAREFLQLPEQQKPISLAKAFEQGGEATQKAVGEMLGGRRFSEVQELNELWQLASKNETRGYGDAQAAFRKMIAESDLESAKTVRKAFGVAGIDVVPNGESFRFRMKDAPYRRPLKGPSLGGKALTGVAVVGVVMWAGSAAAAEPETKAVTPEQLDSLKSNLLTRLSVGNDLNSMVNSAPGGEIGGLLTVGVQIDAIIKLKALEFADLNNLQQFKGRLQRVENAPYMVDPATGQVYSINMNGLADLPIGALTPDIKLNKTPWGWYYDGKNVLYPEENGKLYLRQVQ